jgi:hypothetical protein
MESKKKRSRIDLGEYSRESLYLRVARQFLKLDRYELSDLSGINWESIRRWECKGRPLNKTTKYDYYVHMLDSMLGKQREEVLQFIDRIKVEVIEEDG